MKLTRLERDAVIVLLTAVSLPFLAGVLNTSGMEFMAGMAYYEATRLFMRGAILVLVVSGLRRAARGFPTTVKAP